MRFRYSLGVLLALLSSTALAQNRAPYTLAPSEITSALGYTPLAPNGDGSGANVTATGSTTARTLADWFANTPNGIGSLAAQSANSANILRLSLTGNIVYSGASDATNSWVYLLQTVSGTASNGAGGYISPFSIYIAGDNVDTGNKALDGFHVKMGAGGSAMTGSRQAIVGTVSQTSAPNASSYDNGYIGGEFLAFGTANNGGTGGSYLNYHGGVFGWNPGATLTANGTYWREIAGGEIDVAALNGSSVAEKYGVTIVQTAGDTAQGVYGDAAISIQRQSTALTYWKTLIELANPIHPAATGATTTLIGGVAQTIGGTSTPIALYGVDLSNFQFQTGGAAFRSNGFSVDPNGNITANSISVSGSSSYNANIQLQGATNTTQAGASIQVADTVDTNAVLALAPKGTGAVILGPLPDATATGGNARGAGAVDLQTTRSAASQVASAGNSTIGGGAFNTASGTNSVVAGGSTNTASGSYSSILGGLQALDRGRYGSQVYSAGRIATTGDAQRAAFILRASTTSTTPTQLTADGAAAGSANCVNIPANFTFTMRLMLAGQDRTSAGNRYAWVVPIAMLGRDSTAASTTLDLGTPVTVSRGTGSTTTVSATADTTRGCLNVTVTAPNTDTWDWVLSVDDVEAG